MGVTHSIRIGSHFGASNCGSHLGRRKLRLLRNPNCAAGYSRPGSTLGKSQSLTATQSNLQVLS